MTDNHSLTSLHTGLVDALNGYETAIEDAKPPELKAVFQRVKKLHESAHTELHEALLARGLKPDDGGSFMSTVHKTVIAARSALVGLDDGSLSAFASGEERIVEDYDKAIEKNRGDASLVALLARQKAKLESEISAMRLSAASAAQSG